MVSVDVRECASLEVALKKFKSKFIKQGVLADIKRKEFYEKPSLRERKKRIEARKRAAKEIKKKRYMKK